MNVDESETLTKSAMRNYFIFIHHRPEAKLQDVLGISLGKMSKNSHDFRSVNRTLRLRLEGTHARQSAKLFAIVLA